MLTSLVYLHFEFIHIITFSMFYTVHFLLVSLCLAIRLSYLQPSPISSHCLVCPVSLSTSTQQYFYLNKLPLAFFITSITPWRSRFTSLHLPLLVSILALSGDIHTNSDPPALSSFSLYTYNICSLLSNDHMSASNDLIKTHHFNINALTEAWINKLSTSHVN